MSQARAAVSKESHTRVRPADEMAHDSTHKYPWSRVEVSREQVKRAGSREESKGVGEPDSPRLLTPRSFADIPLSCTTPNSSTRQPLWRKLRIGAINDLVEDEADRVAALVMQSAFQTPAAGSIAAGQGGIHPSPPSVAGSSVTSTTMTTAPPIVRHVLTQPGAPLDASTRSFVEPRFGYDFSHVRVHTDSDAAQSASAIGARAYAVGDHVVFNAGHFSPHTASGRSILAHELTHVVQQGDSSGTLRRSPMAVSPWRSDVRAARYRGQLMAKRIAAHGLLSKDARDKINRELATFEGAAKEAYIHEVKPALQRVVPIEMPVDYQVPAKPKPVELMSPFDDPRLCGGKCFSDEDIKALSEPAPKVETIEETHQRESQVKSLVGRTE